MKIKNAEYTFSCADYRECPEPGPHEFAFIGRSNVGKSSLINSLCNQKALARISSKPGKTQTMNYYAVNQEWFLVDLPGYGFAKAAKSERYRFNDFVADYLEFREGLTHVFTLIDSRHEPQKIDLNFIYWLAEIERPFTILFTKSDKSKKSVVEQNQQTFIESCSEFLTTPPTSILTSSKTGDGRNELSRRISELLHS